MTLLADAVVLETKERKRLAPATANVTHVQLLPLAGSFCGAASRRQVALTVMNSRSSRLPVLRVLL
jgi:hypothetical protein